MTIIGGGWVDFKINDQDYMTITGSDAYEDMVLIKFHGAITLQSDNTTALTGDLSYHSYLKRNHQ